MTASRLGRINRVGVQDVQWLVRVEGGVSIGGAQSAHRCTDRRINARNGLARDESKLELESAGEIQYCGELRIDPRLLHARHGRLSGPRTLCHGRLAEP